MSALFEFTAFLSVVLLTICTCTFIRMRAPGMLAERTGFRGLFWKAARIGKGSANGRESEGGAALSPYPRLSLNLLNFIPLSIFQASASVRGSPCPASRWRAKFFLDESVSCFVCRWRAESRGAAGRVKRESLQARHHSSLLFFPHLLPPFVSSLSTMLLSQPLPTRAVAPRRQVRGAVSGAQEDARGPG